MIIRIDPQHPVLCFDVWAFLKKQIAEKNEFVHDINFDSLLQLVKWIPNAFPHVSLSQLANIVFIRSPSIPPKWVQQVILDLIEAIKHLHSKGFSGRLLHLLKSYVWCEGGELKLFGVDEKKENFDPEVWLCRLEVDISWLEVILKDLILVGTPCVAWPQRDAFLRGFDRGYNSKSSNIPPSVRLEIIRSDPSLKSSRNDKFGELADLDRAVGGEVCCLENHNISVIDIALKEPKLFITICPDGDWRRNAGPAFASYLTTRVGSIPVNDIYDEVGRNCPMLLSITHQVKT